MRRWVLVAASIFVAACGGRSTPTAPDPAGGVPLHLLPGLYTLVLDFSVASGFVCNPPAPVPRATIPVILQRGDADLTGEAQLTGSSLRLRLIVSGDDRLISGTMFGNAMAEEGVSVDVFGASATEPALISGRADATSVQGMIIGQMTIAGASCTSSSRNWKLTPIAAARAD